MAEEILREKREERREELRRRLEERREERRRRKVGKYVNIEKKLDSGFSSEMEEAMSNRGCDVTVNPMLYRPYSLLRYVIESARKLNPGLNSGVLDLIDRGLVGCGANYDNLGYSWDLYENRQLEAGLKVILRHIQYGPSELDSVYCLEEWSRYFKDYSNSVVRDSNLNTEFLSFFETNSELKEYLENVEGLNEPYLQEIFDKVHRNLAESAFNLIRSGKVKKPQVTSPLDIQLRSMLDRAYPVSKGISDALFDKLFDCVLNSGFDTFDDFIRQGVPEFFSIWLSDYDGVASEVIENHKRMYQERAKAMMERMEKMENKTLAERLEETERFQISSMFGSSEESVKPISNLDEKVLEPVNNEDAKDERLSWDNLSNNEEKEEDLGNTPKRPVRTDALEENSLEKQLNLKLKSAEELGTEIEKLQATIEKIQTEMDSLESSLQVKKLALKPLLAQESSLWDDIEEMQRRLK